MRRFKGALALVVIAPLVAEILPGSAPISQPALLLLIVLVYGPGALLIRDVARARGHRWISILLLGAAYGVIEEGIALQSLFDPVLYNASNWGRVGAVNIVYAEAAIPIHAIWSAAIPILLTDLLFPECRRSPFLGRTGRVITGVWYGAGFLLLGLLTRLSIAPGYRAGLVRILASAATALVLIVAALGLSNQARERRNSGKAPAPWTILLGTTAVGLIWHAVVAGLWRVEPHFAKWPCADPAKHCSSYASAP